MRSDGLALRAPRRAFLGAAATLGAAAALGSAASLGAAGCHPRRAPRGRREASLWFTYGGRNRQALEELVGRFNAEQDRYWIHPIYQGDYYEGLAKLRTALAAQVAPALSHVVGEVIPYLAEAEVLEPLAGYPGASELDVLPALGQAETW